MASFVLDMYRQPIIEEHYEEVKHTGLTNIIQGIELTFE